MKMPKSSQSIENYPNDLLILEAVVEVLLVIRCIYWSFTNIKHGNYKYEWIYIYIKPLVKTYDKKTYKIRKKEV